MLVLAFDSETTGIPHTNLPLDHPAQPRMVQLGAVLCDLQGRELKTMSTLIKPDGWEVDYDSELVHGWTTEDCEFLGIPVADAISEFSRMAAEADLVTAHHLAFDRRILEIEKAHNPGIALPGFPGVCTMELSAPIVGIPYRGGYKWPSLVEAVNCLTAGTITDDDLHDALDDARYCMQVTMALIEMGLVASDLV